MQELYQVLQVMCTMFKRAMVRMINLIIIDQAKIALPSVWLLMHAHTDGNKCGYFQYNFS